MLNGHLTLAGHAKTPNFQDHGAGRPQSLPLFRRIQRAKVR